MTEHLQSLTDNSAMKAYKARWEAVAEVERAELRAMTIEERWQQLNLLFQFAQQLSKGKRTSHEDQGVINVRKRWNKLKTGYA